MAKKYRLSFALSYDYNIIGIASQLRDYKLCFFINNSLRIKLHRIEDIPVNTSGTDEFLSFPFFRYFDALHKINWYLIANHNHQQQFLLTDFKKLDYFLINDGIPPFLKQENFISAIKSISNVQLLISIDPEKSKSLNYLLQDLEMHILEIDRKK